ncbi:MAG: aldolase [Streptosporangiales bacterium]|nr:aldolase [Streptosporangiales bacterium]
MKLVLGDLTDVRDRIERDAGEHAATLARETPPGQPVHTVYVPADRLTATVTADWGRAALRLLEEHARAEPGAAFGLPAGAPADEVLRRVAARLTTLPVEDLRIDFEDGYGTRDDAEEDRHCTAAAEAVAGAYALGVLPPRWGLRVKSFADGRHDRAIRTLDGFVTAVIERVGALPEGFVITFPKIVHPGHVSAMVEVLTRLEEAHDLPPIRFEAQVETPETLLDLHGTDGLRGILRAAAGRLSAAHFGVFDYTAALGLPPAEQRLDHPACDHARHLMQVALAGTGVWLSDGSTNVAPASDATADVHAAWRRHAGHVRHSLRHGFHQGWDLHWAQLPSRFAAVYALHLTGYERTCERVRAWTSRRDDAGGMLDEPATVRALVAQLGRAVACGAVDAVDVRSRTGLDAL